MNSWKPTPGAFHGTALKAGGKKSVGRKAKTHEHMYMYRLVDRRAMGNPQIAR
jgi:hypothetical protein